MTKEQMALMATSRLSGSQFATLVYRLSGSQFATLVSRLSDSQFATLVDDLSDSQFATLVDDLSDAQFATLVSRLSGSQFATLVSRLSGSQFATLVDEIPKVEKLYLTIWTGLENKERIFDQGSFGEKTNPGKNLCNSAICIAGHTVQLADAYEIVNKIGFPATATLIHMKSRPDVPPPRYDSYPDEWALAYIEARAAEEMENDQH